MGNGRSNSVMSSRQHQTTYGPPQGSELRVGFEGDSYIRQIAGATALPLEQ